VLENSTGPEMSLFNTNPNYISFFLKKCHLFFRNPKDWTLTQMNLLPMFCLPIHHLFWIPNATKNGRTTKNNYFALLWNGCKKNKNNELMAGREAMYFYTFIKNPENVLKYTKIPVTNAAIATSEKILIHIHMF
jgi:hypothetical protein